MTQTASMTLVERLGRIARYTVPPLSDCNRRALTKAAAALETAEEALEEARRLCSQVRCDLTSAHAEICKLQNLDPATHDWPEWTPQANTIHWLDRLGPQFDAVLEKMRGGL